MTTTSDFSRVISVNGNKPYDVTIGHDLNRAIVDFVVSSGEATQVAIIHQPVLGDAAHSLSSKLEQAGLAVTSMVIDDAEAGKTLATCQKCWDVLGEKAFGRKDIVIGVGGGAATDLAGFVAAAWMRGVKVIQVPTTLLAMVDAAVGGKTGINTGAGKNLVGAFHEPAAVFIDLDRLATLPEDEIVAGSAEIIKTGFIADEEILKLYEKDPANCLQGGSHLPELIARSVAVKAHVVASDLEEAGLREILNYGHTLGHAIEKKENFTWRHGTAVAVGMVFAAELAHTAGLIDKQLVDRHRAIISSVGLGTSYRPEMFDSLLASMLRDKKTRAGVLRFVVLEGLCQPTILTGPSVEQLTLAYGRISG
ncbi:3-dehydroquinate synthase [Corynebacterium mendelii]|uniref:3-dehydroquinate synthase n=1 Tax=Corynebacterium mendelii TaxID=2765362 RepID=A0A939DY65_9CORY|nr:3-dehydroquinate synthase [Corynebacterium mendelii]MBN9643405.1 3-dehydroquinate synthase [Corynebacterium mendelii]